MCPLHRKIAYVTFQINNFATLKKCIDVFVTHSPKENSFSFLETHSPKYNLTN
jgi:hypothetical protein